MKFDCYDKYSLILLSLFVNVFCLKNQGLPSRFFYHFDLNNHMVLDVIGRRNHFKCWTSARTQEREKELCSNEVYNIIWL